MSRTNLLNVFDLNFKKSDSLFETTLLMKWRKYIIQKQHQDKLIIYNLPVQFWKVSNLSLSVHVHHTYSA